MATPYHNSPHHLSFGTIDAMLGTDCKLAGITVKQESHHHVPHHLALTYTDAEGEVQTVEFTSQRLMAEWVVRFSDAIASN
ncbi:hypothetical protein N9917_00375 [Deltaproteobacteria bacterium]|nr:hypothetical protein [Deltaproteobacteria bacterium]